VAGCVLVVVLVFVCVLGFVCCGLVCCHAWSLYAGKRGYWDMV